MMLAISQRLEAAPALNYADASAYEFYRVGSIKLQIFSVLKFLRHAEMLVMAACLTSASQSLRRRVKV